jgi:nucleotide-binding universal stress UspA family protein
MLRLLLATDGSENSMRAVRQVCALSRRGVVIEAVLCNVRTTSHPREADANATMARGIAELAEAGVRVLTHHATGHAAEEIVRAAHDWDAAAIVMGRRGLARPAKPLAGSVSLQVARESEVPVRVVS